MTPIANKVLAELRGDLDGELRMIRDSSQGVLCAYFPAPTPDAYQCESWEQIVRPMLLCIDGDGEIWALPPCLLPPELGRMLDDLSRERSCEVVN